MKFFLFITIFIFLFSTAPNTFALTPTPSPKATTTPQATEEPKGINILNNLKDRIASRVAQLNLVEKRGILATVEKVTDTQITVIDKRGDIRLIDVDELTHFSSPSAKGTFGISDITKGSYLDILGLYNKQSKRLLARFVDVVSIPVYIHGAVMSQDLENFTVTVISPDSKKTVLDIEKVTKILEYDKNGGLTKVGFSKIIAGEHISAVGYPDVKNRSFIIASRILLFPTLPKDPRLIIPQDALQPQETTVPSTGSGKKLTPITR